MITKIQQKHHSLPFKLLSIFINLAFVSGLIILPPKAHAQGVSNLLTPGTMVQMSPSYNPAIIQGLTLYPDHPLKFDFIIDKGDSHLEGDSFVKESNKLIKYFMASLTVPDEEMWVNLSPYEENRIIADGLSVTAMGRDMLSQDYLLKQLTASLMFPEDELGNEFWSKVYSKAQERYGTTEIPMNTFNKIWIIPDEAKIYVNGTSAFVVENHLNVMLEEDYLALESNLGRSNHGVGEMSEDQVKEISGVSQEIIREILIPEIEKEVNTGKNFAVLRQIFNSMILATWYKQNLQQSILGQQYFNQNKIKGIDLEDKQLREKIYKQYVEAFEKGVYDYIKEDYDESTQQIIPRKYFSGGIARAEKVTPVALYTESQRARLTDGDKSVVTVEFEEAYYEHEERIDNNLIKPAFDESEDWIVAQPITRESLLSSEGQSADQVIQFLTYLEEQNVEGAVELKLILNRLIDQTLPSMQGRTTPQITRILIRDSNRLQELLPTFDHASDRGAYVFIDERNPLSTTEESAWLLHALVAFMGQRHQASVAFDLLFQKWSENREQTISELLNASEFEGSFQQRLGQDDYEYFASAEETFQQGSKAVREHVRANENGRQPDLLSKLSETRNTGRRDYRAPNGRDPPALSEKNAQILEQLSSLGLKGDFLEKSKFSVPRVSILRSFKHIFDNWKFNSALDAPLTSSDHTTLFVLPNLIIFAVYFPMLLNADSLLSALFHAMPIVAWLLPTFSHLKDIRDGGSIPYNAKRFLKEDGNIGLDGDLVKTIKRFEKETGWSITWTDDPYILAWPKPQSKQIIMSIGWVVEGDRPKDRRRLAYVRHILGHLRSHDKFYNGNGNGDIGADQAQLSSSPIQPKYQTRQETDKYGGIDFNPANLNLNVDGNRLDLNTTFDNNIFQNRSIDGLHPVIINVAPAINIHMLLGEVENIEEEQQLSLVQ